MSGGADQEEVVHEAVTVEVHELGDLHPVHRHDQSAPPSVLVEPPTAQGAAKSGAAAGILHESYCTVAEHVLQVPLVQLCTARAEVQVEVHPTKVMGPYPVPARSAVPVAVSARVHDPSTTVVPMVAVDMLAGGDSARCADGIESLHTLVPRRVVTASLVPSFAGTLGLQIRGQHHRGSD